MDQGRHYDRCRFNSKHIRTEPDRRATRAAQQSQLVLRPSTFGADKYKHTTGWIEFHPSRQFRRRDERSIVPLNSLPSCFELLGGMELWYPCLA
jgi:hypothetical protein